MTDFKPFTPEKKYEAMITKEEALLIKKLRSIGFGQVTVHIVNKKIIRFETNISELVKDIEMLKFKVTEEIK